jgi:hypothetical protein
MAFFGNYIASIISDEQKAGKETTAASMAARMCIRHSMMSRFLNDPKPRGVHPRTLEKMCRGISDDPIVRAGLRIAYLKDHLGTGRDADLVRIHLDRAPRAADAKAGEPDGYDLLRAAAERVHLDAHTVGAVVKIIEASAHSVRFRRCVRDLADIAKEDILT